MNSAISMLISLSSASSTFTPRIETGTAAASSSRCACLSRVKVRQTVKVVPAPFRLSRRIVPSIFSTSSLTMASPSPVPVYEERAPASSCANGSKARC